MKEKVNQVSQKNDKDEDAEMKESYVEPPNDDHLEVLKSVIIEQQ